MTRRCTVTGTPRCRHDDSRSSSFLSFANDAFPNGLDPLSRCTDTRSVLTASEVNSVKCYCNYFLFAKLLQKSRVFKWAKVEAFSIPDIWGINRKHRHITADIISK